MKKNTVIFLGIVGVFLLAAIGIIGGIASKIISNSSYENKTASDLITKINVTEATPVKGTISLENNSLYDELPEITKYPLSIEGRGDIDIEIFSSPEKAESGNDGWLLECANSFNKAGITTANGKTVSISVRDVTSGLAADYIISNKYTPDLYTPSSSLWGEYINVQGGNVTACDESLVGNTAGFLVKKGSGYTDYKSVIEAVKAGKINVGYTNPQVSSAGMNLLLAILKDADPVSMTSPTATEAFTAFQNNIPYVAYNTVQMKESASNGSLDGMVSEYQSYVSDSNLNSIYDFIPYGIRHDNPLYVVNQMNKSDEEMEAIKLVDQFLKNEESQKLATKYGFNNNEDYQSAYEVTGAEVTAALDVYKSNKDNGKDIVAVFVADCSGSMDGAPMMQLKESLSNGMNYINENNYIGLVSYSNNVTVELPIAKFDMNQKAYFQGAIDGLYASGGTASYNAIVVAEDMIEKAKVDHPNAKTMIFLLSDGAANQGYSMENITPMLQNAQTPVYTISYGSEGDLEALKKLSNINEAASINADSDDIIYKIKSLFNSQM